MLTENQAFAGLHYSVVFHLSLLVFLRFSGTPGPDPVAAAEEGVVFGWALDGRSKLRE